MAANVNVGYNALNFKGSYLCYFSKYVENWKRNVKGNKWTSLWVQWFKQCLQHCALKTIILCTCICEHASMDVSMHICMCNMYRPLSWAKSNANCEHLPRKHIHVICLIALFLSASECSSRECSRSLTALTLAVYAVFFLPPSCLWSMHLMSRRCLEHKLHFFLGNS